MVMSLEGAEPTLAAPRVIRAKEVGSHRHPSPKLVSQVKQVAISKNCKILGSVTA